MFWPIPFFISLWLCSFVYAQDALFYFSPVRTFSHKVVELKNPIVSKDSCLYDKNKYIQFHSDIKQVERDGVDVPLAQVKVGDKIEFLSKEKKLPRKNLYSNSLY